MSVFDDLEDAVSDEVDALFGETFQLLPMTKADVNVRSSIDEARMVITFVGVFDERHKHHEPHSGGLTDFKRISMGRDDLVTVVSVDNRSLDPTARRTGDKILRVKTGVTYVIDRPKPDGIGRTVIELKQI